jgi:hypothetical protein
MCRTSSLCIVLALLAVGSLIVGSASAGSIAITNASFDNPVVPIADGSNSTVSSDGINMDYLGPWIPAGWTNPVNTGAAWYAVCNTNDTAFTNSTDTGPTSGVPTGGDGRNVFLYNSIDTGVAAEFQSTVLGGLTAGTYTLTAAVGCQPQLPQADGALILGTIDNSGNFVDLVRTPFTSSQVPLGSFADVSATVTVAAGNAHLGQALYARLAGVSTGGSQEICFDNVRLDGPALGPITPEPGTLTILASGLIGLLCYAWRKRK